MSLCRRGIPKGLLSGGKSCPSRLSTSVWSHCPRQFLQPSVLTALPSRFAWSAYSVVTHATQDPTTRHLETRALVLSWHPVAHAQIADDLPSRIRACPIAMFTISAWQRETPGDPRGQFGSR
jgi:hypothetical protein